MLIGIPGSGKSTWARENGLPVLSSDETRQLLSGDETNQSIHGAVFSTLRFLLRQRLEIAQPVTVIDATNLRRRDRKPFVKIAQRYGAKLEAVVFAVSPAVAKERNRKRARQVPDEAIDLLAARFEAPCAAEGFEEITTISA